MALSSAVLVIDLQIGLVALAPGADELLDRVGHVLARARAAHVPVVHVQHSHATYAPLMAGAPTWRIHPRVAPFDAETVISKTASDAFYKTSLLDELTRLGVSRLIVAGMQTEYCVDTTCRRALSLGFDVTLVSDGHTTCDGVLPAADVVRHHNTVLAGLAHPDHRVAVVPSRDITFEVHP
jgi:nicotinamidase-related amidase